MPGVFDTHVARRERWLLGAWVAVLFGLSAASRPDILIAAALVLLLAAGPRGLVHLRRALVAVLPITLGLWGASALLAWWRAGVLPAWEPLLVLSLRAVTMTFGSFVLLARVSLLRALAPWPSATRLLAMTLAQIHVHRRLVRESWLGLLSRMPRKPKTREVLASTAPLSAALLALSLRNARDASDALRARGA